MRASVAVSIYENSVQLSTAGSLYASLKAVIVITPHFVLALVMTRILLNRCFWLPLVRIAWFTSSLAFLLVISGCSGSQLGDSIGQKLEPDPQLAENSGALSSDPAETNTDNPATPDAPSKGTDSTTQSDTEDGQTAPASSSTTDSAQDTDSAATSKTTSEGYTDIEKAHEEIRPYLIDLLALNLLEVRPPVTPATPTAKPTANSSTTPAADSSNSPPSATTPSPPTPSTPPKANEFRPNQAATRREYARWLLTTNNRFYSGQRTHRIRPAVSSSQPVFQDVKANDPDFAAIQGLAEAGMIPSPLTGSSTTLTFRPDAPLTRKDLLLWKVPLDTRQPLPQATAAAVQLAWGFQDAAKIEARALQAVLADHQNGDFANIQRAFGYTTLFQPDKAATRAEAAAVLWRIGNATEAITAAELRAPQVDSAGTNGDPQAGDTGNANTNTTP